MAKTGYMTVETTALHRSVNFSMIDMENDIENGAVVGKGELADNETSIYKAEEDYSKGAYLVAHPAWSYDDCSIVNQNEENFINKKGIPFRTYRLEKDHKFKIANVGFTEAINKGDKIEYKEKAWKKAEGDSPFKVVAVEEVGFPYCIGSAGVQLAGDGSNDYGYSLEGMKNTKYTVEYTGEVAGE